MFWNHKPSGEELLAAYLDPSVEWSAEQDQQLRQWVRSSPEARDAYDKRVIAHRILLGLDGDTPSRVERDRMMSATVAQSVAPSSAKVGWLRLDILIPVGAMALVAMIALPVLQDAPLPSNSGRIPSTLSPSNSTDYLGTRGGDDGKLRTAIGVSGVSEKRNGEEYEVLHRVAHLEDRLRFYYRCDQSNLGNLFLFGLQDGEVLWYFPLPAAGEKESVAIDCREGAGRVQLEGDTLLSTRHREGQLRIFGIFTEGVLSVEEVKAVLDGSDRLTDEQLRERIPLQDSEIIHSLTLTVESGTYGKGQP